MDVAYAILLRMIIVLVKCVSDKCLLWKLFVVFIFILGFGKRLISFSLNHVILRWI